MAIGWYPGHMNKARKDIIQALKKVHAVIEVVDARLPYSSENPLLHNLTGDKPTLKLLNKADIADPELTTRWLAYYADNDIAAIAVSAKDGGRLKARIVQHLRAQQQQVKSPFRLMIAGIPNVGKSTLINALAGRKAAKTGNEPAVTKGQQQVMLDDDVALLDTPGILWPKIENQDSAYRLAMTGAIKNTAIEFDDIALYAIEALCQRYPESLRDRYQLSTLALPALEVLKAIGRQRGCLVRGGVDYTKAGEVLLNDLRSGKLGTLTLESPEDIPVPAAEDDEDAGDDTGRDTSDTRNTKG